MIPEDQCEHTGSALNVGDTCLACGGKILLMVRDQRSRFVRLTLGQIADYAQKTQQLAGRLAEVVQDLGFVREREHKGEPARVEYGEPVPCKVESTVLNRDLEQ